MNKELKLVIPLSNVLWAVFMYFPGCFLYHMIYLKQVVNSNYTMGISGPRILFKSQLTHMFPSIKHLHG